MLFFREIDVLPTFIGQKILNYQWIEDSLRAGEKVSEDLYIFSEDAADNCRGKASDENLKPTGANLSNEAPSKKIKTSQSVESVDSPKYSSKPDNATGSSQPSSAISPEVTSLSLDAPNRDVSS